MTPTTKTGKYVSGDFFYNVRRNAEKRNIPFSLTIEDLDEILVKQDFKCAYTGRKIDAKTRKQYTASVDRIDSSSGYTKDNSQMVCVHANIAKWKLSEEEFLALAEDVYSHKIIKE